jgi:hypothetical protein
MAIATIFCTPGVREALRSKSIPSTLRAIATIISAIATILRAIATILRAIATILRAIATILRAIATILRAIATILRAIATPQPDRYPTTRSLHLHDGRSLLITSPLLRRGGFFITLLYCENLGKPALT